MPIDVVARDCFFFKIRDRLIINLQIKYASFDFN